VAVKISLKTFRNDERKSFVQNVKEDRRQWTGDKMKCDCNRVSGRTGFRCYTTPEFFFKTELSGRETIRT